MGYSIDDLQKLMQRLRDPERGCPWDIEQSFESIKPHTIEEAYEVADAIERKDMHDLKDELGDLLLQVVFHAQMASESGHFNIYDIITHVTDKMIFRHPHVFENTQAKSAKDVEQRIWEEQKEREKQLNHKNKHYYLDDVTRNLPSLLLAQKLQKRVKKTGFVYADIEAVFAKVREEIAELEEALRLKDDKNIEEEYGDLLLITALLGSELRMNPEECLRKACLKFIDRFNKIEDLLKSKSKTLSEASIDEMVHAWSQVKQGN